MCVGGVGKRVSAGHEKLGSSFQWLCGLLVRVNQRTAPGSVRVMSLRATFSVRAVGRGEARGVRRGARQTSISERHCWQS